MSSKVTPTGGGNNFSISRSSPSNSTKSSFNNVLENKAAAKEKSVAKTGGTYSSAPEVVKTLDGLVQKGAPTSQIVRVALQNNPVFQLLSPERQNEMVKQLVKKVGEDPSLSKIV